MKKKKSARKRKRAREQSDLRRVRRVRAFLEAVACDLEEAAALFPGTRQATAFRDRAALVRAALKEEAK